MNRSNIEWCDFTWNFVHGCRHGCTFCYAARFAKRLAGRGSYPKKDPFQPVFDWAELEKGTNQLNSIKTTKRVFVCSMGDIFGKWEWVNFNAPDSMSGGGKSDEATPYRAILGRAGADSHMYQLLT